jgi:outer membrane protein OmpA-like peptidoglycan-associated protein
MVRFRAALMPLAAALLLQMPVSALAQTAVNDPDVVPAPATPGQGVLLYPGGQYGRVVQPLLQPGAPYPGTGKPLHLHMPVKRVVKVEPPAETPPAAVASTGNTPAVPPVTDTTPPAPAVAAALPPPPPAAPPPPKPAAKKVQVAKAPPPPPPSKPSGQNPNLGTSAVPFSLMPGVSVHSSPPEPKVATANPPPDVTPPAGLPPGLTKQMQIIFAPGVPDPSPDAIDAIKGLGVPLNAALVAGASQIQVVAYGGARGDKSSDARRLSLKRGRIIRQLLIDGGVPAEHVVVRAMGGATDGNAADRVDIFTRS